MSYGWAKDAEALRRFPVASGLDAFSLSDEGDCWWLMYRHAGGVVCPVAQIDCPAVLEALGALLGVDVSGADGHVAVTNHGGGDAAPTPDLGKRPDS